MFGPLLYVMYPKYLQTIGNVNRYFVDDIVFISSDVDLFALANT